MLQKYIPTLFLTHFLFVFFCWGQIALFGIHVIICRTA